MCDTLCVLRPGRMLFAKNSDRPVEELQVVEAWPARPPGGRLATQYLSIPDTGAAAVVGSRPVWLWGFEHGVNEHRVAIGNEKVWTVDDPRRAPPALIGMDLVRLGLERARSAEEAVAVITDLLATHGQGGVADEAAREPYWSSFLLADPTGGFVLETSGRTWAAEPVAGGAAISNRISIGAGWSRASPDVAPGTSFDAWRDPSVPTAIGDLRLAVTRPAVAQGADGPRELAALLRHHGERPWGAPGGPVADFSPPPEHLAEDFTGITVCMHVRGYQATTAAFVAELPADPAVPLRAWVALGSPCASVFVPVFPPHHVPAPLGEPATAARFAALRERVERDGTALAGVRAVWAPIEAELWDEADEVAPHPDRHGPFVDGAWERVAAGLRSLGA